jgi:MinD superfamily P-loop ATPase
VTEPTPFGMHDLKLALAVTRKLRLRSVVLLNKKGLPGPDVESFCRENGISIVGEIEHKRTIAETYSNGRLLLSGPEHRLNFESILKRVLEEAGSS